MEASAALMGGRVQHRWRRGVVAVLLVVVALSVLAMHQLSFGHLFVAPAQGPGHAMGHASFTASASTSSPGATVRPDHEMVGAARTAETGGCAGCGTLTTGPAACLLALTLLVLAWWLRLPRARPLPPRRRQPDLVVLLGVRPLMTRALSLAELSVLRT